VKKISIITCCKNGASTLKRCFNSIKKQTEFENLEWIFIDDCSNDNSLGLAFTLFNEFDNIKIASTVTSKHKKNAFNLALDLVEGDFFLNLDVDDELVDEAIKKIFFHLKNFSDREAVLFGLSLYPNSQIVGDKFGNTESKTYHQMTVSNGVKGDKYFVIKTSSLAGWRYPDIDGYVPEGAIFLDIDRKFECRFIDEPLRIYHPESQISKKKVNFIKQRFNKSHGRKWYHLEVLRLFKEDKLDASLWVKTRVLLKFLGYLALSTSRRMSIKL